MSTDFSRTLTLTQIAMLADNAGEIASLECLGSDQASIYLTQIYNRMMTMTIILPSYLSGWLDQHSDVDAETVMRQAFIKSQIPYDGVLIDLSTQAYFATYHAVWVALQAFRVPPKPAPATVVKPPKPGQAGYYKRVTDQKPLPTPGFDKV